MFGPLNEQKSDWYNHRESGPLVLEQDGVSCFVRTDKAADPDYVDLDTVSETPVEVPFVGENCYAIGFFRTVNSASDIYENDIRKEIENNFEYDANRPISEQIPEEIEPNSILGSLLAHREQWWSYCRANEGIGSGDPSGFVQLHTLGPYSGTNLPMVLSREPQRVRSSRFDHHYDGDCYGCSPDQFHMVFGDLRGNNSVIDGASLNRECPSKNI